MKMFRLPISTKLIPCTSFLTYIFGDPDRVTKDTKTAQSIDLNSTKPETGLDRVKRIFTLDEFEHASPEVISILQMAYLSTFIGAVYGGFMSSRTAYVDFMKKNQATSFTSHWEAKKKLQDSVTISFGKGAFRWAWRLALFSTSYMTISTCISTYRGKNGIIEYVIAGSVSGTLYKFFMGPRGWIVGGCLGATLGAIGGSLIYGMHTLTGLTMEDTRYWQYKWKENRSDYIKMTIDRHLKDQIMLRHEEKYGEAGKSLDNLPVDDTQKK